MIFLLLIACADPTLAERLKPLIDGHKGTVAVGVKHLQSGAAFFHDADRVMPTASLIKLPLLIETYLQADEGKVSLKDHVTLREEDKVPGSGILTYHFSGGATFPLRDACRLMAAYSDNTATNLVIDKVGIKPVNDRMAAWGLKETRLQSKVFRRDTSVDRGRSEKYGLGSTTAREMVTLWETLMLGDKVRPAVKWALIGHLKKNEDKDKFPRLLPPGTVVAHKDGSVNASRTDAGVLFTPKGAIVVVVLTDRNKDQRWGPLNAGNALCANVARAVYDHYNPAAK